MDTENPIQVNIEQLVHLSSLTDIILFKLTELYHYTNIDTNSAKNNVTNITSTHIYTQNALIIIANTLNTELINIETRAYTNGTRGIAFQITITIKLSVIKADNKLLFTHTSNRTCQTIC